MFYSFLFLVVIFSVSQAEEQNCGISPSLERYKIYSPNRIFGGEHSNEGDFPWYIWLYASGSGCSGTIIHKNWILTAAHCIPTPGGISVYYGSVDWKIMKTQKIKALQYFVHPEYVPYINDIALIELNGTLEFNEYVQPICLDSSVDPYPNEILTEIGMGSDYKKRVEENMTFLRQEILQDTPIQFQSFTNKGREIQVGDINHVALPGDSGGPLLAIRNNRWIQVGVASTYNAFDLGGETISLSFINEYTRVSYYCKWIQETTKNEVLC